MRDDGSGEPAEVPTLGQSRPAMCATLTCARHVEPRPGGPRRASKADADPASHALSRDTGSLRIARSLTRMVAQHAAAQRVSPLFLSWRVPALAPCMHAGPLAPELHVVPLGHTPLPLHQSWLGCSVSPEYHPL